MVLSITESIQKVQDQIVVAQHEGDTKQVKMLTKVLDRFLKMAGVSGSKVKTRKKKKS